MKKIKDKNMIPAVVFAYDSANAFGVIKSLSLAGVPITGLSSRKNFVSLSNKFQAVTCVDPAEDYDGFVNFLIKIGKKNKKSVIFGSIDIATFAILQNEKTLSEYYYYPYLDKKTIDTAFNKWTMFKIGKKLGIPVPHTVMPEASGYISEKTKDPLFPSIVKPLAYFVMKENKAIKIGEFYNRYNYAKALRAQNKYELAKLVNDAASCGFDILIQEEISGGCENLYETRFYVDRKGTLSNISVVKKVRCISSDLLGHFGVI